MTNSKRVLTTTLAGATLLFASGASHGLGFGRPVSRAILGDTLWITVPLRVEIGEEITDECLAAEVFFGDDKVAASAVSTALQAGPGNERSLRVSTTALINEPVVTIYLAAGCKARITRKFIAFADPPVLTTSSMSMAKAADMEEVVNTASMPKPDVLGSPSVLASANQPVARAQHEDRAPASRRASKRSKAFAGAPVMTVATVATDVDALQADKPVRHKKASSDQTKAQAKPSRHALPMLAKKPDSAPADASRLVLDPVEADAMFTPALRMSSTLGSPAQADEQSANAKARHDAAAAIWLALNATPEQMARDRQRLQELEQRLAQLKQEGEQSHAQTVAVEARAKQAEARSSTGTASWLLGLLAMGGVAAAAYLWRQLREEKKRTEAWWQSENQAMNEASRREPSHKDANLLATLDEPDGDTSPDLASIMAASAAQPAVAPAPSASMAKQTEPQLASGIAPAVNAAPTTAKAIKPALSAHHSESTNEVSVEELIDLEQQAEFFAVLGQDDAAISLLEGHVQHTRGGSPLPFLKLLEAYHRVGQQADFERVGADFALRFDALVPQWRDALQGERTLADYPDMVTQLQSMWMTPREAMAMLEKTLTRPEPGTVIFDLPAYRELLFLYAVARDLSERDVHDRTSIDLLLPVTDTSGHVPSVVTTGPAGADSLMRTRPNRAMPEALPRIEIDLPLEDLQVPADIHKD